MSQDVRKLFFSLQCFCYRQQSRSQWRSSEGNAEKLVADVWWKMKVFSLLQSSLNHITFVTHPTRNIKLFFCLSKSSFFKEIPGTYVMVTFMIHDDSLLVNLRSCSSLFRKRQTFNWGSLSGFTMNWSEFNAAHPFIEPHALRTIVIANIHYTITFLRLWSIGEPLTNENHKAALRLQPSSTQFTFPGDKNSNICANCKFCNRTS